MLQLTLLMCRTLLATLNFSELKNLIIVIFQIIPVEDEQSQLCPITTKLVLDQDEETKMPIVQVHRNLVTRLKPHQVDGQSVLFKENINEHSLSLFHSTDSEMEVK